MKTNLKYAIMQTEKNAIMQTETIQKCKLKIFEIFPSDDSDSMRRQTAVTTYFSSKQLLLFAFTWVVTVHILYTPHIAGRYLHPLWGLP